MRYFQTSYVIRWLKENNLFRSVYFIENSSAYDDVISSEYIEKIDIFIVRNLYLNIVAL